MFYLCSMSVGLCGLIQPAGSGSLGLFSERCRCHDQRWIYDPRWLECLVGVCPKLDGWDKGRGVIGLLVDSERARYEVLQV
jgi:hypothetical protein